LEEWWRNCVHRLERVQVTLAADTVAGVTTSIGGDGSLLIQTDDHRFQKVSEGSVRLLDE
jgi:biotin-(acetyl-CoA carboxylase) ligase